MKTVIVTGASRGIGKCIAENLAKENYNVVLNYNKSEAQAKKIKEDLKNQGYKIEIYKADISIREEVKKLINFTIGKFQNVDILINNAGIAKLQMFNDITDKDWNEMINTNLNSIFYTIQETLPTMIHNKCGCIINISSIWGIVGASCEVAYSTSKAGINGLTKALAKELGPSNIRVNAIAPGIINTDMNSNIDKNIIKELKEETPLNKIGEPEDIYKCVKWLIEDNFTTGQVISPNGGYVIY
jgi:3-oxoacyl-[acyl-carrier protein] reductase